MNRKWAFVFWHERPFCIAAGASIADSSPFSSTSCLGKRHTRNYRKMMLRFNRKIKDLFRWTALTAFGVLGLSACTNIAQQTAATPHASATLPPAPVAIALGPISAFEFDAPRRLQDPLVAAEFSVVDLPFDIQPSSLMRARAPVSSRRTAGATLIFGADQVGDQPRLSPSDLSAPSPLQRPSHDQSSTSGEALCDGQPIVVHNNGGGLRAANLTISDDVHLPAGTILCGSGHISSWHSLSAQ